VLKSGINFIVGVMNHVFNLDMVCAAESARTDLHPRMSMEFILEVSVSVNPKLLTLYLK
jgi:hypothetical protein